MGLGSGNRDLPYGDRYLLIPKFSPLIRPPPFFYKSLISTQYNLYASLSRFSLAAPTHPLPHMNTIVTRRTSLLFKNTPSWTAAPTLRTHFSSPKQTHLSPLHTSFLSRFSSIATSGPTMEAAQKKAQQLINDNAVVVFSKSYCPYCRNTKRTLDNLGAKYVPYELDVECEFAAIAILFPHHTH